jgi:hypothetical protein
MNSRTRRAQKMRKYWYMNLTGKIDITTDLGLTPNRGSQYCRANSILAFGETLTLKKTALFFPLDNLFYQPHINR